MHLEHRGTFVYNALDAVSGMVEYELDHVYLGRVAGPLRPSAVEVEEVAHLSLPRCDRVVRNRRGRSVGS